MTVANRWRFQVWKIQSKSTAALRTSRTHNAPTSTLFVESTAPDTTTPNPHQWELQELADSGLYRRKRWIFIPVPNWFSDRIGLPRVTPPLTLPPSSEHPIWRTILSHTRTTSSPASLAVISRGSTETHVSEGARYRSSRSHCSCGWMRPRRIYCFMSQNLQNCCPTRISACTAGELRGRAACLTHISLPGTTHGMLESGRSAFLRGMKICVVGEDGLPLLYFPEWSHNNTSRMRSRDSTWIHIYSRNYTVAVVACP